MPTSTNVTNLKINELTEAQYDTAVQGGVIGANELSIITDMDDAIQVDTMPTAAVGYLDKIVQYVGATDSTYTNGYFYKCVSDGQNPATYSWVQTNVQPAGGGSSLPSQTGNAGKFLTTDGTDASWGDALVPGANKVSGDITFWAASYDAPSIILGYSPSSGASSPAYGVVIKGGGNELDIREKNGTYGAKLSVGKLMPTNVSSGTKDLGGSGNKWTVLYVTKINNGNDITVPTVTGSMAVQVSSMPAASSTLEGQIYQFTGTTDSTYTHGYIYECVSDGGNPATYSWSAINVQAGGGGSSYTAGTGVDITSGVISVTSPTLANTATGTNSLTILGTAATQDRGTNIGVLSQAGNGGTACGVAAQATGQYSTAVGDASRATQANSIAIGRSSDATAQQAIGLNGKATALCAIQIGGANSGYSNSDANTVKIANSNGNYEMMSADGTIPHARLTNAVQSTTVTIATTDWSSNTASVTVSGLTATSVVWVAPDNASQSAYTTAGVYASAQATDTLTFTCSQTPASSLTVNIVWC